MADQVFSVVICLRSNDGLDDVVMNSVEIIQAGCPASYVQYLPPNTMLLAYAGAKIARLGGVNKIINLFQDLAIQTEGLQFGWSTGQVIGRLSQKDTFVVGPLGDIVNAAMRDALKT